MPRRLILASTSAARKALIERLGLPYDVESPFVNEARKPNEAPGDLATRLAIEKAQAIAVRHPDAIVIGSDQVACQGSELFGKPGSREAAIAQLQRLSGHAVDFLTAVALIVPGQAFPLVALEPFRVHFRKLSPAEITRYVDLDHPEHCAGAFKLEQRGILLFDRLEGNDYTALIGLPLIALARLLREAGVDPMG